MRSLFSIISLLIIISYIVWLNAQTIDTLFISNGKASTTKENVLTPIEDAKGVRQLIESKTVESLSGMTQ